MLITGGSGGIGSETARRLRERGCEIALVARDAARLTGVAEAIGARAYPCDVLDLAAFTATVERIEAESGEIDALLHAVGSIVLRPLHTLSLEEWTAVFDRNVTSAFIAMKAVLPKMMRRRAREHRAVFIGRSTNRSALITKRSPALKPRSRASSAPPAITYSRYGIRVNAIAPGLTETELSKNLWSTPELPSRCPRRCIRWGASGRPAT